MSQTQTIASTDLTAALAAYDRAELEAREITASFTDEADELATRRDRYDRAGAILRAATAAYSDAVEAAQRA